jgi:hypothetical protein
MTCSLLQMTYSPPEERWIGKARLEKIVRAFKAPFDVTIASKGEVDEKKDLTGHIVQYAVREGVEI